MRFEVINMYAAKIGFMFVLCVSFISVGFCQAELNRFSDSNQVWNSVIRAKGGRERLQAVRSLGVQYRSGESENVLNTGGYGLMAYEFPLRVWIRVQDLPYRGNVVATLIQEAIDGEKGVGWWLGNGKGLPSDDSAAGIRKLAEAEVCKITRLYLLESKWYRPAVIAVDESHWKGRDVLVVYVDTCSGPAAYIIDPQTRLPTALVAFPRANLKEKLPPLPGVPGYGVWEFLQYESVAGIQMPKQTTFGRMKFEINVNYPRSLFTNHPTPTDWGPFDVH